MAPGTNCSHYYYYYYYYYKASYGIARDRLCATALMRSTMTAI